MVLPRILPELAKWLTEIYGDQTSDNEIAFRLCGEFVLNRYFERLMS
jgi:hypothetical protein